GSEVKGSWTPYFGFFSPINLKPNKSLSEMLRQTF
ncbi:MAG: hypothetical protein BECKG1743D_GA0114223_106901, partial [Candidatus Kentron sp. G]